MDQNYFVTPFASLGDQTVIPIPTDSGGAVSMQQGWGPDYQRDQSSDPLAKPIDRATTNWLLFVATQAIAALQRTGIPEWITPANNNGTALAYAKYAQVRYSATTPGVTFETYVSTIDGNTSVPGADANWQPIASIVASASDVVTGTSSRLSVTPLTLKSYPGNTAQTFNVAPATATTHAAQLAQTIIAAGAQCRLAYSGGNLVLSPYKGLYAYIPGSGIVVIPSGGITLAPSGLTANQLYYIYLYLNAGVPTLLASITTHATDVSTGIEIMSGDNTKMLVGMERAAGSTTWAGLARSWNNDPGFAAIAPLTASVSTTSTIYAELSTTLRVGHLVWASEIVIASADGQVSNSSGSAAGTVTSLGFDGTAASETENGTTSVVAGSNMSVCVTLPKIALAEGYHYVTVLGAVGGGTGTWGGGASPGSRLSCKVYIAPRK